MSQVLQFKMQIYCNSWKIALFVFCCFILPRWCSKTSALTLRNTAQLPEYEQETMQSFKQTRNKILEKGRRETILSDGSRTKCHRTIYHHWD